MPDLSVIPEDTALLRQELVTCPIAARELTIVDDASFHLAATFLRRLKAWRDAIDRRFALPIKQAFDAHRALVADRKRLEAPLAEAAAMLKAKLARFTLDEETRRAAAARRQMAAAGEAHAAQIWTEVEALEAAGCHTEAADLVTDFVTRPAPLVIMPTPVTADGLVRREHWKYEIVDVTQVPREYLTVDHHKLGAVVRALKGVARIPGVRVWAERTIAVSTR
jgi:hypothetical protein